MAFSESELLYSLQGDEGFLTEPRECVQGRSQGGPVPPPQIRSVPPAVPPEFLLLLHILEGDITDTLYDRSIK